MKHLLLILCTVFLLPPARGQEQPDYANYKPSNVFKDPNSIRPRRVVGGSQNAAMAYFDAWDMLPRKEYVRLNELAGDLPEADKKLSAELRGALREHSDYVDALMRAAATEQCDWGFDWSAGWEMLLPHLGWTRASCRVLAADARRCMEDGSPIAAVERVAAILRVGQHASEGPILISSLVGIAIDMRAVQLTNDFLDRGQITPAQARQLLSAVRAVPRKDLCNARASIIRERQVTIDWLREKCASNEPGMDYSRLMREMGSGAMEWFVAGMTRERFEKDLTRADRCFELLEKAWDSESPLARLDEISEEIGEFQHGLIACSMLPAFGKARMSVTRAEQSLDKLERRLEALAAPEKAEAPQQSKEVIPRT